jgi:hypothetical protein
MNIVDWKNHIVNGSVNCGGKEITLAITFSKLPKELDDNGEVDVFGHKGKIVCINAATNHDIKPLMQIRISGGYSIVDDLSAALKKLIDKEV